MVNPLASFKVEFFCDAFEPLVILDRSVLPFVRVGIEAVHGGVVAQE